MNNLIELAAHLARNTPRVKAEPETLLERGPYRLKRLEDLFYVVDQHGEIISMESEEWRAREFFHGLEVST